MDLNSNILCFSKDKIFGEEIDENSEQEKNSHLDYDYIDVFTYENMCQEYNFRTGQTALYIEQNNGQYELLFENVVKDNLINASYYSKNSAFVLTGYNPETGNIQVLDYFPKTDYIRFLNKLYKDFKISALNNIYEFITVLSMYKHSTRLIGDGSYYNSSDTALYLKEYKDLFIKYGCATTYIPVYNILSSTIEDLNTYISTNKLNMQKIKRRFSELQNFKDICPNSISLLSSFIENPNCADLKNLCNRS